MACGEGRGELGLEENKQGMGEREDGGEGTEAPPPSQDLGQITHTPGASVSPSVK